MKLPGEPCTGGIDVLSGGVREYGGEEGGDTVIEKTLQSVIASEAKQSAHVTGKRPQVRRTIPSAARDPTSSLFLLNAIVIPSAARDLTSQFKRIAFN
jgi:hypothetical protein